MVAPAEPAQSGADACALTWEHIVQAAKRHTDPGTFTAFTGFEWTSVPKGFNLHRNVMLRDGPIRALQVVLSVTQAPHGRYQPQLAP